MKHEIEEWVAYSIFYEKNKEGQKDDFLDLIADFKEVSNKLKDKEKQLSEEREKGKNNTDHYNDYNKYCQEHVEDALKKPKSIFAKAEKYYYKVLPFAEYIDDKIPWFGKKWDSRRYDYKSLKAIADFAKEVLFPKT